MKKTLSISKTDPLQLSCKKTSLSGNLHTSFSQNNSTSVINNHMLDRKMFSLQSGNTSNMLQNDPTSQFSPTSGFIQEPCSLKKDLSHQSPHAIESQSHTLSPLDSNLSNHNNGSHTSLKTLANPKNPTSWRHHFRRQNVAMKFTSVGDNSNQVDGNNAKCSNSTIKIEILDGDKAQPKLWRRSSYHQINRLTEYNYNYNCIEGDDLNGMHTSNHQEKESPFDLKRSQSMVTSLDMGSLEKQVLSSLDKCILKGDFDL